MANTQTDLSNDLSSTVQKVTVDPDRNMLLEGFGRTPASALKSHALEQSEKTFTARNDAMHMQILKDTQGLHAPLRLLMEREAASKVGRLPFLTSSNLMTDVLTGRDEDIGPEHLFNTPEDSETAGTPLLVMQKSLNLM